MSSLITASVASMPERKDGLHEVVQRLLPQVDRMIVYLNNYTEIPEFLNNNNIVVCTSQDHGDLKDAGKFFLADQIHGYHIVLDDDLIYPLDYVDRMLEKIDGYERKYCMGVHGIRLRPPLHQYYQNRKICHFCKAMKADRPVHLLGTGTLAYHTDTMQMCIEEFKKPNMADIWFALKAQQEEVGLMCVARPGGWLKNNDCIDQRKSIFNEMRPATSEHVSAISSVNTWRLFGQEETAGRGFFNNFFRKAI